MGILTPNFIGDIWRYICRRHCAAIPLAEAPSRAGVMTSDSLNCCKERWRRRFLAAVRLGQQHTKQASVMQGSEQLGRQTPVRFDLIPMRVYQRAKHRCALCWRGVKRRFFGHAIHNRCRLVSLQ
jgi:hypothetical protein